MLSLRKPKFGSGRILILFVIGLLGLIIYTGNHRRILGSLFSPTAVLIFVIILIEYLLLKGADRSEIYRRELNAARQKRRDDLLALREMEQELTLVRGKLEAALQAAGDTGIGAHEALRQAHEGTQKLQDKIRERI